jgi:hypothetical protein
LFLYKTLDSLKQQNDTNESISELNEEVDEDKFLETINIVTVPQSNIDDMILKVRFTA